MTKNIILSKSCNFHLRSPLTFFGEDSCFTSVGILFQIFGPMWDKLSLPWCTIHIESKEFCCLRLKLFSASGKNISEIIPGHMPFFSWTFQL